MKCPKYFILIRTVPDSKGNVTNPIYNAYTLKDAKDIGDRMLKEKGNKVAEISYQKDGKINRLYKVVGGDWLK